jgi:predicted KAP-like P-loop ATPase
MQVIKDLKLLGELLSERLTKFQQASGKKDHRIVVFIDDLDKCKPSSIIEVGDISMLSSYERGWFIV